MIRRMFGGWDGSGPLADTWEWDGIDWLRRSPAVSPSPRLAHALEYDPVHKRVVLFGGGVALPGNPHFGDTWTWDGISWSQQRPVKGPPARIGGAIAYDAARNRVVLVGGASTNGLLADTWLFGGSADASSRLLFNDCWQWDGSQWISFPTRRSPKARRDHAMVSDARERRLMMFGGVAPTGSQHLECRNDTWFLDMSVAAGTAPFGIGCGGVSVPNLSSTPPRRGLPALLDLWSARAHSPAAVGIAGSLQNLQIGPCTLHLGPPLFLLPISSDANGFASVVLETPADRSWLRTAMYAQAFVLDPLSGPGIAFTPGLRLLIGDG